MGMGGREIIISLRWERDFSLVERDREMERHLRERHWRERKRKVVEKRRAID